ncbi:MAG: glycosyltransferase [Spirochaetales bacterium]|nr:glycosyltransferase [Spirochaetales bacterium]
MAKTDLHVHSKYSDHPSEWFLQRMGTSESYTEPEFIYDTAKKRGMSFVTICDHNSITGALELTKAHPDDCFVSVESTVYFPGDGCKVHILLFDITEEQFEIIQELRSDIYKFRDYVRDTNIAYSVAHATYSVNGAVGPDHLEKLILLFDIFETINGGRNKRNNSDWEQFLSSLTKDDTDRLIQKHGIKPMSDTPWLKGYTAGSDDHAGIFIAKTYTETEASTKEEFIQAIRRKSTRTGGRHHDFHSMAFAIYKIAFDFIHHTQHSTVPIPVSIVLDSLFNEEEKGFKKKYTLKRLKKSSKNNSLHRIILDLIEEARKIDFHETDARLDILYKQVTKLVDRVLINFIESVQKNLKKGNIDKLIRNIAAILPAVFLSIPFISTLSHMFNNRNLVKKLYEQTGKQEHQREKRILWFTDTLTEMNGVAITVKEVAWISHTSRRNIQIAASFSPEEDSDSLPPNIMHIPAIESFPMPQYEKLTIKIPSFLKALKMINDFDPDEIYISTPLPIGLLGLAASKILNIPSVGIYHTDGALQAKEIINDITMTTYIDGYLKWFYANCTKTLVNTKEYAAVLKNRGYRGDNIGLFTRGIDTGLFQPLDNARDTLRNLYSLPEGVYSLFAGRVSADKGIDLAIEAFLEAAAKDEDTDHYLLIAGHGPEEDTLREKFRNNDRVRFLGRIDHATMPLIYGGSDIFVFPSQTDTFGRVVAEAMSCGLPAIVDAQGGPQEIVGASGGGIVIEEHTAEQWAQALSDIYALMKKDPEAYRNMRHSAREHIIRHYSMQGFIDALSA